MQSYRAAVLLIFSNSEAIRIRVLFCCIHFLPEKDKEKETKVWKSIPSPSNNSVVESSMQQRQMTSYLPHCPTDTCMMGTQPLQIPCPSLPLPIVPDHVLSKPDSIKLLSASLGDKKRENLAVISSKACFLASRLGALWNPHRQLRKMCSILPVWQRHWTLSCPDPHLSKSTLYSVQWHQICSSHIPVQEYQICSLYFPVNNSVDDAKKGNKLLAESCL